MNILLISVLIFIAYMFYTSSFEYFTPTDIQKENSIKIFTFLNSNDKSYINYLTYLNDQKIPAPKLFTSDVYNKFKNNIKTGTITLDNLDLIYNYFE